MKCLFSFFFIALLSPATLAEDFPQPLNSEPLSTESLLLPKEAADKMQFPAGFEASVFAAEPDVQNPIAMAWDAKGRLWIAENYTYAEQPKRFEALLRDRVLIFDDADGDGCFDSRKVFTDDVQRLTSVEVGHGGVWLMCPPRLLFIPDADRDDRPDGTPQVVLDGFTVSGGNSHNFANGLRLGPDGWLYGRCGHSCPGLIGQPGTPEKQRYPLRGGIWRYHPRLERVEVLTSGTVNPWGHDWNARGEAFFVNTVTGHLWQMIPGAHYQRREPRDPYNHVYEMIDQHADHYHFDTGQDWTASRDDKANSLGGGHAHSGAMIYLGDNWPNEYRDRLFTVNLHGRRLNQEILEREGSGYVGKHGEDIALSADPWFRGIDLSYGPDGGVYLLDWSDTGECHENTGVHRTSGRIYKITYAKDGKKLSSTRDDFDLAKTADGHLFALQSDANEWFVRQARLELARRADNDKLSTEVGKRIRASFEEQNNPHQQLRILLTLHSIQAADRDFLLRQTRHKEEHIRAWAVRLLTDAWPIDGPLGPVEMPDSVREQVASEAAALKNRLIEIARQDDSPLVRLVLASTMQRLPVKYRTELAAALVAHPKDADDHNLPLMVWYGLIPVSYHVPESLVSVAEQSEWPKLRQFIARRLAEDIKRNPEPLNELLVAAASSDSPAFQRDVVAGVQYSIRGWKQVKPPAKWSSFKQSVAARGDHELSLSILKISLVFGDADAKSEIEQLARDAKLEAALRRSALQSLIDLRPTDLRATCETLFEDDAMRLIAAQGLASFDDPKIGELLIESYHKFPDRDRPAVISLLVSRVSFAKQLLKAVGEQRISSEDLSAYHIRHIYTHRDNKLTELATSAWGAVNDTPRHKEQTIARWWEKLTPERLSHANHAQGSKLFAKSCLQCHRMYGEGGTIGPDLTGSNRNNLDYLLQNIVHPSAVVDKDYCMTLLVLDDGRILNGLITAESPRTLSLQTSTEKVVLERDSIQARQLTHLSLMPDGLLDDLSEDEVRDLIGYLMQSKQAVPAADKAKDR